MTTPKKGCFIVMHTIVDIKLVLNVEVPNKVSSGFFFFFPLLNILNGTRFIFFDGAVDTCWCKGIIA